MVPTPVVLTLPPRPQQYPTPLVTFLSHGCSAAGWSSHVTRVFDREAGYCGRCDEEVCNIELGVCHQPVNEYLTLDQAEELVTIGRPRALPCSPPFADLYRAHGPCGVVADDQAG